MTKTIAVLGDLIKDINLFEYPRSPSTHYEMLPTTVKVETAGGVAYLTELLDKDVIQPALAKVLPYSSNENNDIEVHQIWEQFKQTSDKECKTKVWRVKHLLGRSADVTITGKKPATNSIDAPSNADIVVIDSLGLGWLEKNMTPVSPEAKEEGKKVEILDPPLKTFLEKVKPGDIVIKISSLHAGVPLSGTVWQKRMTIILSVKALRARGAAISEGLSWDRTIEDVVREFEKGVSALDLGQCKRVVVLFSAEGAAVFEREGGASPCRLKKFIFNPSEYEGSFKTHHPGHFFGDLSIVTAAIIRHMVDSARYPLFVSISLALSALRQHHADGLTIDKEEKEPKKWLEKAREKVCSTLSLPDCLKGHDDKKKTKKNLDNEKEKEKEEKIDRLDACLKQFACTFRHDLLDKKYSKYPEDASSNLLSDATGYEYEYVAAKAFEIVIKGTRDPLKNVPVVSYGKYLTADRDEIERINSLKKLIISYRNSPDDRRPLSIAVFGPPGSGKSFAIKQLAEDLKFDKKSIMTFNLSQFRDLPELHTAFHIVRDASVRGEIPLVFWDEFDTADFRWIKEFLAPMQDAEFQAGSVIHPFGKAIFVFAGGVCSSFQEFDKTEKKDERQKEEHSKKEDYKKLKIPDFISRLRGYVNIKGPNPPDKVEDKSPQDVKVKYNNEHLIRRAILLRSLLEKTCGHLTEGSNAAISAPVAQAFLRVGMYKHGARSMEALVTMSNLVNCSHFGESALPSDDLLNLHVDEKDFRAILQKSTLEMPIIELIAEACHEAWMAQKKADGYVYGVKRSDIASKTHPLLKPYSELTDQEKEGNRITARLAQAKLLQVKLTIKRAHPKSGKHQVNIKNAYNNPLMRIEHDIWMRDHLLSGYEYAETSDDKLKLHRCVRLFGKLSAKDKKLDKVIVDSLFRVLRDHGYVLVKSN